MTDQAEKRTGRAARRRALAEQDARDEALWRLQLDQIEIRPGDPARTQRLQERNREIVRLSLESERYWHEEHKRLTRGGIVQQMWRSLFT